MNNIKSIKIQNLHNNGKFYEVGQTFIKLTDFKPTESYTITEIDDDSKEYYDSVDHVYSIYGKTDIVDHFLLARIKNCSVLVEYF